MNTRLLENLQAFIIIIPMLIFPFTFTTAAEQLRRFWRVKLSRVRSSRSQIKLAKAGYRCLWAEV